MVLRADNESFVGISIDRTCLCATLRPYAGAVHLLVAVDHHTGLVLSQTRVDEKTSGALGLLQNLVFKAYVVVLDASFCEQAVCEQVLDVWHRRIGTVSLAATIRSITRQSLRLFTKLGLGISYYIANCVGFSFFFWAFFAARLRCW